MVIRRLVDKFLAVLILSAVSCGNSWCVGYDINNDPYYAICLTCGTEYVLDEEGNFLFPLRNNNN